MHFLSLAVYLCFSAAALLVTAQNDRSWVEETKNGKKWRNYRINSWVGWQEKSTNLDPDRSTQARNVLIAVFTIINRECFGLRKCHQKRIYFFLQCFMLFSFQCSSIWELLSSIFKSAYLINVHQLISRINDVVFFEEVCSESQSSASSCHSISARSVSNHSHFQLQVSLANDLSYPRLPDWQSSDIKVIVRIAGVQIVASIWSVDHLSAHSNLPLRLAHRNQTCNSFIKSILLLSIPFQTL